MREDQDAARLRALHEAERRYRLARARRVLEPEALCGVGVLRLLGENLLVVLFHPIARLLLVLVLVLVLALLRLGLLLQVLGRLQIVVVLLVFVIVLVGGGARDRFEVVVVLVLLVVVVLQVLVVLALLLVVGVLILVLCLAGGGGAIALPGAGAVAGALSAVAVLEAEDRSRRQQLRRGRRGRAPPVARASRALRLRQERRQCSRQRIHLVRREDRAILQARLLHRQQPFEAEQQREAAPPLRRGVLGLLSQLLQRRVQCAAAGRAGGEHRCEVLAIVHERLAHEALRALDFGGCGNGRGREGHWRGLGHEGCGLRDGGGGTDGFRATQMPV